MNDSTRTPFPLRMLRAAMLHADTFEEVEAEPSSILQATLIVLGACASVASGLLLRSEDLFVDGNATLPSIVLVIEPLVTWLGGSAFAFMIGASFFRGDETESDYPEVLRTTGFAFTPSLLVAFAFVLPAVAVWPLVTFLRLWTWIACIVAVRQALDFTTARAIGTFGVSALLFWVVLWGLSVVPVPG